ncbi:hypothetical protein ACFYOT_40395 [Saccharothrix saharensis]
MTSTTEPVGFPPADPVPDEFPFTYDGFVRGVSELWSGVTRSR